MIRQPMQNMPVACFAPCIYALCAYTVGKAQYEDGYGDGIQQSVKNLMDSLGYTIDQALDALKITGEDRETIAKAVNG